MDKVRQHLRQVPWWTWVALGLGVVIAIWLTVWLGRSCSVPGRRIVMKALGGQGGGGGIGCFEFWFYRYQGLVAAVIALGAAMIAVRPVWVQLAEMRRQSAEMAKQSAQQAFLALRTLRTQLMEESIIVREIELNADYSMYFERTVSSNLADPGHAQVCHKDFEARFEELNRLDQALRESAARTWGSSSARSARDTVHQAIIDLRKAILSVNAEIGPIVRRFEGTYNVAEWQRASNKLLELRVSAEAGALKTAGANLQKEIRKEDARLEPALRDATQAAFGFS